MLDRLARVVSIHDHTQPGRPVKVVVAAHRRAPRWLVLRVARAQFAASLGDPAVSVKRESAGRPVVWEVTWFPHTVPATTTEEGNRHD